MKRRPNQLIDKEGISSPQLLRKSQKVDHWIAKLMILKAENPHLTGTTATEHYIIDRSSKGKFTSGLQQGSIIYSGFNIFSC